MRNHSLQQLLASTLILFCLVTGSALSAAAQGGEPPFVKGSKSLGLSVGFGVGYDYISGYSGLPAIAVTYDQGFFEKIGPGTIGIGAMVGLKTAHYNYGDGSKATWNNYFIGLRGTYHLTVLADKNNKFDPYAGITLGVRIYQYKDSYIDYTNHTLYPVTGAFVGVKYNFVKNFGAFAELGYDVSFARIGASLNF